MLVALLVVVVLERMMMTMTSLPERRIRDGSCLSMMIILRMMTTRSLDSTEVETQIETQIEIATTTPSLTETETELRMAPPLLDNPQSQSHS